MKIATLIFFALFFRIDTYAQFDSSLNKLDSSQNRLARSQNKLDSLLSKPDSAQNKPDSSLSKPDSAQNKPDRSLSKPDTLLSKPNEDIVFAFQLKDQQWVSVCKEKNGKYLVCRIVNKNKIELQVPAVLDSNSWKRFNFSGYNRGGGRKNGAMHFAYLSFGQNKIAYEVHELWNSQDSIEHCGLTIMINNKATQKPGVLNTRKGNLLQLLYNDRIKKEEEN
jgi:hypothetical protein